MKWTNRLILNKISKVAITLSLAMSVTLAGFTFYGDKVGNFVVSLDKTEAALALSVNEDPKNQDAWQSRLSMQGLKRQRDATFTDIPAEIDTGMGVKNDPKNRFMAFTFWLVNASTGAVDYEVSMKLSDSRGGAASAMRILVIENERLSGAQPGKIYAAEETDDPEALDPAYAEEMAKDPEARLIHTKEEKVARLKKEVGYETVPFVDEERFFKETRTGFEKNGAVKYTFVVWLEGWDYDCSDNILGSTLKMQIDFAIIG